MRSSPGAIVVAAALIAPGAGVCADAGSAATRPATVRTSAAGRIVGTVTVTDALPPNPLADMAIPPPGVVRGDRLVTWHERGRPLEQPVDVRAGADTRLDIVYPGPAPAGTQP